MYRTVFKQKTNMADITQSLKYTDIYSNNSNNDNNSKILKNMVKSVDNTQKKTLIQSNRPNKCAAGHLVIHTNITIFNTTVNIVIFYGYVLKVMCKTGQTVCVDFFF